MTRFANLNKPVPANVTELSPTLDKLVTLIAKLPGLGRKSASRIALHLLQSSTEEALELAQAIQAVKEKIHLCASCGNLTEDKLCRICTDPKRDTRLVCVVESPTEIIRLEKTAVFRGLYHVLGGTLSPLDGVGPESLRIQELKNRLHESQINEVILALSPTTDGDTTSLYLMRELKEYGVKVSRIARGVPVGADIEHVDEVTLARAMVDRTSVE
ncbi:recombination mediator RecR [bacterium]|nr:recombination mediator RecR [bacterium]